MNSVVSLLSRHIAGVLAAKILFRGLRVAKMRHLIAVGAGAYLLHKAFGDKKPARPMEFDALAAFELDTPDGPWKTPAKPHFSGVANGITS